MANDMNGTGTVANNCAATVPLLTLADRAERLRLDAAMLATLRPYQLEMIPNVRAAIRSEADEYSALMS